ncbi:MAG: bifunctional UDP-N-acetylmuramoyl-tripeptide:D-alanyl-D-alanine ligase/alanine racemase [Bacteroidales bacterium]
MQYLLSEVAKIVNGELLGNGDCLISELLTDSRSLIYPEESLFFAFKTKKGDGHNYIKDLYYCGVRAFVVTSLPEDIGQYSDAGFIKVPNALDAIQLLSKEHRSRFTMPLIAITGSNGKTIVKEWLYQLLNDSRRVTRSPRSFNSQIGVPLSLWKIDRNTELAIIEAGISEPEEMKRLRAIIAPTIGLFTTLGEAHSEGFSSKKEKCLEKISLFKDCDLLIYNADNALLVESLREACLGAQEFAWSRVDKSQPLYIDRIITDSSSSKLFYFMFGVRQEVVIPFVDDCSIENAIQCLAVMLYFGYSSSDISEKMSRLESIPMRLELKEGRSGCQIINDSYNLDMSSLETSVEFLNRRSNSSQLRKCVILSDLNSYGMIPVSQYRQVSKLLRQSGVDRFIGIGKEIMNHSSLFEGNCSFYASTQAFLLSGCAESFSNELILLKGARSFCFEEILERLELKLHETILEVNLGAIASNLNYYRSKLEPSTKIIAMVKAFGYGAGAFELAKTLQEHRCDYIAVAVVDEGVELRKSGITMPIIVMNPEMGTLHTLFNYNLEPEVYSLRLLKELKQVADRQGLSQYPIHLKIDTGMNRLGFRESDLDTLIPILEQQDTLRIRSLFSHLVASEDPAHDEFTINQIALFTRCADRIDSVCTHKVLRHILNTGGIERFASHQMDMVRLGIGLYGVTASGNSDQLESVSTLKSTILQIKDLSAGESVGYGRRTILKRDSRIATIPIGYADGLDRRLGNGAGSLFVDGIAAPIVGNICMDLCMIDISDIPQAQEGDKVVVFGKEQSIERLAKELGTIPYEILTSISLRVKRVYFL